MEGHLMTTETGTLTEFLDAMRAAGVAAWSRQGSYSSHVPASAGTHRVGLFEVTPGSHIHRISEPTRVPGQTARRYRAQRRAWARFQSWQRKLQRRREATS